MTLRSILILVAIASFGGPLEAKQDRAQSADLPSSTLQLDAGVEHRIDRYFYHFENPSNFNTTELVEHFFKQRYHADNNWLLVRGSYQTSRARRWWAEAGFAPEITTFGEDLDTFFNPDGNVIVAGTSGDVDMLSLRASGWRERTLGGGLIERIGYSFRRDRAHFHVPELRIVRMSNPPSMEETLVFTHETTISNVHQLWVGWGKIRTLSPRWRLRGDIAVAPATIARLTTILPEKYPGRNIVFWASGVEFMGRVALSREARRRVDAFADLGRTVPYMPSARFVRNSLGVGIRVGFAP